VVSIGTVVNGKYRLTRLLGDGGMGSVYDAQHVVLGTRVAIKVLHPDLARSAGLVERFLQEARVAAQIRSPHVVQVTDVDRTADGHAYIVMELLEGEPLSGVLDRQRKLPIAIACDYTLQILQALEAAHALGVIHRDLKPENVFVTFAGGRPVLKLIDFGIAKARRIEPGQKNLTIAGVVMGTAEYMAPEQARSADKVDARADVYAAGVMLYEMIAGARPVQGDDARVVALRVEQGHVTPLVQVAPEVPREIAGLVHRAMAPRPEMRFASATEMRLALERAKTPGAPAPVPQGFGTQAGPAHGGTRNDAGAPAPLVAREVQEADAPPVHTVRAPPIASALAAHPAYGGAALPAGPETGNGPRRRGKGSVVALVAIPVLLGAGAVAALVASGTFSSTPSPLALPSPPSRADESEEDASRSIAATATQVAQPGSDVPKLVPTVRAPSSIPLARPVSSTRSAGNGSSEDGGAAAASNPPSQPGFPAPPFGLPSGLPTAIPPLPSVLPFPQGFPSAFPSAFPQFPAWPQAAPPNASSSPAPSGPGY
jgi:serine/threonine-protein kinase